VFAANTHLGQYIGFAADNIGQQLFTRANTPADQAAFATALPQQNGLASAQVALHNVLAHTQVAPRRYLCQVNKLGAQVATGTQPGAQYQFTLLIAAQVVAHHTAL